MLSWRQVHGAQRSVCSARAVRGAGQGQGQSAGSILVHSTTAHRIALTLAPNTGQRRRRGAGARRGLLQGAGVWPAPHRWLGYGHRPYGDVPHGLCKHQGAPLPRLAPALLLNPSPSLAGSAVLSRHEARGRARSLSTPRCRCLLHAALQLTHLSASAPRFCSRRLVFALHGDSLLRCACA